MHVLEYLNKYLMHRTYKNDYQTIRAYKSIQGMRKEARTKDLNFFES